MQWFSDLRCALLESVSSRGGRAPGLVYVDVLAANRVVVIRREQPLTELLRCENFLRCGVQVAGA